jgi:pimeloyl-ACP methyl ester carboxylesterase
MRYGFNPATFAYKEGLPRLQGEGIGKGPIIAKGAGHMVIVEAPDVVAQELLELVETSISSEKMERSRF